jgi:pimeloyl-ACP methyl ester carboxylesterase
VLGCAGATLCGRHVEADMQTTQRTIAVEDIELYVEEHGIGEPLLLLHGLTGTGADWRHVFDLDALAQTHHVITVDARGHGQSTNPGGAFTFRQCAADVMALLDVLGVERTSAIGASLGAKTLLHVATEQPARVSSMVLVSGTPRFPEATRALFRAAAAAEPTPEEWSAMRALHVHGDEQIAALWALPRRFAEDEDDMTFTADRLARITAKTLIVSGDRDPLYPVELAVELYRGIPRSSLWIVPGGGHSPIFLPERDAFVRVALPFLGMSQRLSPSKSPI